MHLRIFLKRFTYEKLYGKFTICAFWMKSISFLGNVVTKYSIMVDTAMIVLVCECAEPTSPIEI